MLDVPTPIQTVNLQAFEQAGITLLVKRDDLIHPQIIGNKLRKSLPHIQVCLQSGHSSLVTFGGRFSNHLLAIAQAGQQTGLFTTGIVRGTDKLGHSVVLDECRRLQMNIIAVNPNQYDALLQLNAAELAAKLGLDMIPYLLPEGGTSSVALDGVAQIIEEITELDSYQWIVCAVGTGGTAAGLAWGLAQRPEKTLPKVLAISTLRGYDALPAQGQTALVDKVGSKLAAQILARHLQFEGSAPWGRYGKPTEAVMQRMRTLQAATSLPLDYVYTGKVLLQLEHMVQCGYLARGSKLLFLHTGGYQTAPL